MSGREGKFSGFVTEGISSIAVTDGLVGPRFALAIVAVVGLVGLIVVLCTETTGKGPACPGLECCRKREETITALWTTQTAIACKIATCALYDSPHQNIGAGGEHITSHFYQRNLIALNAKQLLFLFTWKQRTLYWLDI